MSFHKVITKGTGAGGANTNKNGLSFEDKTCLTTMFPCGPEVRFGKSVTYDQYRDISVTDEIVLSRVKQNGLNTYMKHYCSSHVVGDCKKK